LEKQQAELKLYRQLDN